MNSIRQIARGGGINKAYSSKFFKPIVATSLALALSTSFASANPVSCPTSGSAVCWDTTAGTNFQQFTTLKIEPKDGSEFNKLQFSALTTPITDFTLKFIKNGGGTHSGDATTASVGGKKAQLKLTNETKGLQLGSGDSTLTIDFGEHAELVGQTMKTDTYHKTFLNFNGVTNGTALKGNLKVIVGHSLNNSLNAIFKGNMEGNIEIINGDYNGNLKLSTEATFTFQEGAKLKGNLTTKLMSHTEKYFIFEGENGGIEGNIKTYGHNSPGEKFIGSPKGSSTNVNITFKEFNNSTNFIKGKNGNEGTILAEAGIAVTTSGDTKYNNALNRILFQNNGKIGEEGKLVSIIASSAYKSDGIEEANNSAGTKAKNLIQFQKDATLHLNNLQAKGTKQGDRHNLISLEGGNNTLKISTIQAESSGRKNFIGKGFLKFKDKISNPDAKDLIVDTTATTTPKTANIATGTLTAETIISKGGGQNTILIEELVVNNGIFANASSSNTIFVGSGNSTIGTNGIDNQGGATSSNRNYAIYTGAGGTNAITLEDSANLTIKKNIETADGGTTTFNLNGTNTTLTLEGAANTITTLATSGSGNATINLGTLAESATTPKATGVSLKVKSDIGNAAGNLAFSFNTDSSKIEANGDTNKITTTGTGKTHFNLNNANATIEQAIESSNGGETTISFNKDSTLTLTGGITAKGSTAGGLTSIIIGQTSTPTQKVDAIIKGEVSTQEKGSTTISFNSKDSSFTLKNGDALKDIAHSAGTLAINFNSENGTFKNKVTTTSGITKIQVTAGQGEKGNSGIFEQEIANSGSGSTTILLGATAGENGKATLTLQGANNTISTLTANVTESTLITQGAGTTTIANAVSVDSGKTLNLEVKGQKLSFTNALSGTGNINAILNGSSATNGVLTLANQTNKLNTLTVTNGNSDSDKKYGKLVLNGASETTTTFAGDVKVGKYAELAIELGKKVTLALEGSENRITSLSLGSDVAAQGDDPTLQVGKTTGTSTTTISNAVSVSGANKVLNLNVQGTGAESGNTLIFEKGLSFTTGGAINATLGNGATLALRGTDNKITSLSREASSNDKVAIVDISSENNNTGDTATYNTLTIGTAGDSTGLSNHSYTFKLYASKTKSSNNTYADRVVIESVQEKNENLQTLELVVKNGDTTELNNIASGKNGTTEKIALAIVKGKGDSAVAQFKTTANTTSDGKNFIAVLDTQETDSDAKTGSDYTTYFLKNIRFSGASEVTQKVSSSALALNFDLFTANFNSINKRLGDLRNNPYNQGAWARVFGGSQESNFGAKVETSYVTAQGGYDYALDLDNAKNYIGVALSYATSSGKSLTLKDKDGASRSLDDIKSGAFEVAVYNSYISNVGLYNDTIAKFSYITSDFKISGGSSHANTPAFLLSNEVGYRFALGAGNDWFIDPQVELGLGYIGASHFNAKLGESDLKATQQSVLLVRSRAGASFGKEFRGEDWATSLYVGTFYEYDVINGGKNKITFANENLATPTESYTSNGRFVLNVGTNVEVAEATRIYLDVETNFGDTYKKLYQVNVGARYSFGDKATKATMTDKEDNKAPLKVQITEEQEEAKGSSN
ncbi:hypothetical protein BBW65_03875 [Helicobacter enhydrae]|uniref:Autotransporter domain-containing protein n=1 Tax=Helicobacter enhydrae TaxID=222136 RepID=A0A1B1U5F3_9HELI|nr:autotransporter outer membrane beta-barrel domain-containing protein [Helicobacter enhydrae]ANV97989.1 hypothetical protein BBW65_03875 [Helicobacter enhydrae]